MAKTGSSWALHSISAAFRVYKFEPEFVIACDRILKHTPSFATVVPGNLFSYYQPKWTKAGWMHLGPLYYMRKGFDYF